MHLNRFEQILLQNQCSRRWHVWEFFQLAIPWNRLYSRWLPILWTIKSEVTSRLKIGLPIYSIIMKLTETGKWDQTRNIEEVRPNTNEYHLQYTVTFWKSSNTCPHNLIQHLPCRNYGAAYAGEAEAICHLWMKFILDFSWRHQHIYRHCGEHFHYLCVIESGRRGQASTTIWAGMSCLYDSTAGSYINEMLQPLRQ